MSALPESMTIGEAYGPAMKIDEQVAADAYFEQLVERCMRRGKTRQEAEAIERLNLGYYAGYYDNDTRARVERLFRCRHPMLGAIAEVGPQTAEECLSAGARLAASTAPATKEAT